MAPYMSHTAAISRGALVLIDEPRFNMMKNKNVLENGVIPRFIIFSIYRYGYIGRDFSGLLRFSAHAHLINH